MMSIMLKGYDRSVQLKVEHFNSVKIALSIIDKPKRSDITSSLSNFDYPNTSLIINTLAVVFLKGDTSPKAFDNSVISYGPASLDDKPSSIRAVAPSITHDQVLAPRKSIENEVLTLEGRVAKPRNSTQPGKLYHQYKAEFIELIRSTSSEKSLVPLSIRECEDLQSNSTQRNRQQLTSNDALVVPEEPLNKAFQKNEAYGKPSDPRNISTSPQGQLLNFLRFIKPFSNLILKNQHYYMPGKNGTETAEEVCKFVAKYDHVVETDFSRFDGSLSPFLRSIERDLILSYFNGNEHYQTLVKAFENDINVNSRTNHRIHYNSGSGRISGSALTTEGNTLVSAFVDYCAIRKLNRSPKQAHAKIGPKYGDDGLTFAFSTYETVCNDLGLQATVDKIPRGQPVKFLSRVFLDPLNSLHSIYDPKRFCKIHASASSYPDSVALKDKCVGLKTTDSCTPLIRGFLLRHHDKEHILSSHDREGKFKAKVGPWPQDSGYYDAGVYYASQILGVDTADIRLFDTDVTAEPPNSDINRSRPDDDRLVTEQSLWLSSEKTELHESKIRKIANSEMRTLSQPKTTGVKDMQQTSLLVKPALRTDLTPATLDTPEDPPRSTNGPRNMTSNSKRKPLHKSSTTKRKTEKCTNPSEMGSTSSGPMAQLQHSQAPSGSHLQPAISAKASPISQSTKDSLSSQASTTRLQMTSPSGTSRSIKPSDNGGTPLPLLQQEGDHTMCRPMSGEGKRYGKQSADSEEDSWQVPKGKKQPRKRQRN
jgi:hypothetical protein